MDITTVFFDLDGTLLRMDEKGFTDLYFRAMTEHFASVIEPEELPKLIWAATKEMVANTDPIPNMEVFVTAFKRLTGGRPGLEMGDFEGFYRDGFRRTRAATARIAEMIEAVRILKDKGYRLVLATNPLFPRIAIDDRIAWAGLDRDDFAYVSSFEENCYCKPQPRYYAELLEILGLDGRECLMVGNHEVEDLVASTLGFGTYLVTDDLIEDPEGRFVPDRRGSSSEFLAFVRDMPPVR